MKSDSELLQEFSGQRSQSAFAELVGRHVDLVYSAALRQVNGDVHLARDVAQLVFIDLSRKARQLDARESLVGWLYTSVHHAAANAVRSERRRRTHEQRAAAMQTIEQAQDDRPDWEQLRPVLDEAMLELDEADRDAVLRRFFSGESFAAIGEALELSHEAARKRVERALDRLRGLLARRGITSSASALGLALSQHAVSAAPAGFGLVITHAAVGGASGLLTAGSLFLMNKFNVGITAAIIAAFVTFLVSDDRVRTRLQNELARQHGEIIALQESNSSEARDIAASQAKLRIAATGPAEPAFTPIELEPPVTSSELLGLDGSYAPLFRRLRLPREKLPALRELLALRIRGVQEVQAAAKLQGLDLASLTTDEVYALRLIAARDVDAKIRTVLGTSGLEYVQTYDRTLPHRRAFEALDRILAAYDAALSPEQSDQLVAWAAADSATQPMVIPHSVVAKAAAILTPLQLEKLKLVQAARAANASIVAMNQVAAESGKLRLTPLSAKAYATRAAESATDTSK
jgi:RNA polymerase sigma factor (sigma-70 family)